MFGIWGTVFGMFYIGFRYGFDAKPLAVGSTIAREFAIVTIGGFTLGAGTLLAIPI